MSQVTVVDYGLGNLFNLVAAFRKVGAEVMVTDRVEAVLAAERLVLPGVGAFGPGIATLRSRGLYDAVREFQRNGRPLLGICLGMQFFLSRSEEDGIHEGLNFIAGDVVKFDTNRARQLKRKVPQISWNHLVPNGSWASSLLAGLPAGASMYFVHSFYAKTSSPSDTLARTTYAGHEYSSVIAHGNVTGVQFHPERSGDTGLRLLANFLGA